jgi:hypothetical protein
MNEIREMQLQCLNCKTWYRSPIQFKYDENFDTATLQGTRFGCPACATRNPLTKANVRWSRSDGKGGWVGNDTTRA